MTQDEATRKLSEFRHELQNVDVRLMDAVALEQRVQEMVHELARALMVEVFSRADTGASEVQIDGVR